MPDELPNHPESVPSGVTLDGPPYHVHRPARACGVDPLVHGVPGLDDEAPIVFADLADSQSGRGVAVHPVQVDGHVHIDNVPLDQRAAVGDPMADHLVHRGTHRLWVAPVVEGAGVAATRQGGLVDYLVELVGGDPRGHLGAGLEENLGGRMARPAHPLNLVGGTDRGGPRRSRVAGRHVGGSSDTWWHAAHGTNQTGSDRGLGRRNGRLESTLPFGHPRRLAGAGQRMNRLTLSTTQAGRS